MRITVTRWAAAPLAALLLLGCQENFEEPLEAPVAPPAPPAPEQTAPPEDTAETPEEFDWRTLRLLSPEAAIEHMDANGNGVIDLPGEAEPRVEQLLTSYDLNEDGQLTEQEFAQARADRLRRLRNAGSGATSAPAGRMRPIQGDVEIVPQPGETVTAGETPATPIPVGMFDAFDANTDGQLSQSEIPAAMREEVLEADADGDGAITKAELEAYEAAETRKRQLAE